MLELLGRLISAGLSVLAFMFIGAGVGALIGNALVGLSKLIKRSPKP